MGLAKLPEFLYNNTTKKINGRNVFIAIIVLALIIVIILLITGVIPITSSSSVKTSNFSSPEDMIMKKETIKIKPLDLAKEPFNNDLPNPDVDLTAGVNADGVAEGNVDYSDIIASEALEKSVFDQHKAYVSEKNKVTNTASRNPARSDSQDLIPFVGLRRPQYQVEGKDMVDSTARQVPSIVDANQLAKPNNLRW